MTECIASPQLMTTTNGAKWREDNVDCSTFNTNKDIDKLIQEVHHFSFM